MAFNFVLQRNMSDKNHLDKSLTTLATVSGELKNDCSIIDPIIRIYGSLSDFTQCNYMTVESFGRSYFVNNITSVNNDIVELTCHVDVLTSFKTQIRQNRAIIKRQEKQWNLYLNDGTLKVYSNPEVFTVQFPSGFTTQEFVLAIAGG